MATKKKDIELNSGLKQKLTDKAWRERTSAAAELRRMFTEYANGTPQPARKAEQPPLDSVAAFTIDPVIWEKATRRAAVEGLSIAEVGRREVEKYVTSS